MRVVLDTNVLISALIGSGPTRQLVDLWKNGKITPLISKQTAEEALRVLAYPKFGLSEEEIKDLFERHFLAYTEPVKIKEIVPVIKADPSDDVFLACALSGKAEYLVSGDKHLLSLKHYEGIPTISVKEFLSVI